MQVITRVAEMQRLAQRCKRQARVIGLVPTMGYLHHGHVSLVKACRKKLGPKGLVVVSIYVNPAQFGPGEDFQRYPRDFERDKALCEQARADVVFAPPDEEIYPGRATGRYSTYIVEERLSATMEGASRPGHFRGVTTVVGKLFNIVLPDIAYFGAKDYQQAAIIRRMAENLNFPVKILVAPTIRERDGLAMSSRNVYLTGELRSQATVLSKAIAKAKEAAKGRKKPTCVALKEHLRRFIEQQPAARVDYIEFFDPETLQPAYEVQPGVHMALAVYIGNTRLIDNARL